MALNHRKGDGNFIEAVNEIAAITIVFTKGFHYVLCINSLESGLIRNFPSRTAFVL